MSRQPTPVTIIGGFLGAGKTSLLSHILKANHGRRIAVLVNDFGEINIDSELIVNVEGETVSLTNGCVCCSIRDDLMLEVLRLLDGDSPPDHIVIETSGVSEPAFVAHTFLMPALQGIVEVDSIISVVDADQILGLEDEFKKLAARQIGVADLVLLNKIDLVDIAQIEAVRAFAQNLAPDSRLIETTHGRAPISLLLGMESESSSHSWREASADSQNHSAEFETWTYSSRKVFTCMAVRKALEEIPAGIYRAKGFVDVESKNHWRGVFQMTGGRAWLRLVDTWVNDEQPETRLVFIGKKDSGLTSRHLAQIFDDCAERYSQAALDNSGPVRIKNLKALSVQFV